MQCAHHAELCLAGSAAVPSRRSFKNDNVVVHSSVITVGSVHRS